MDDKMTWINTETENMMLQYITAKKSSQQK